MSADAGLARDSGADGRNDAVGTTDSEAPAVDIRFLTGSPTPEELAAATAVLSIALEQAAAENRRRDASGPDSWARSQRALRGELPATWRAFG